MPPSDLSIFLFNFSFFNLLIVIVRTFFINIMDFYSSNLNERNLQKLSEYRRFSFAHRSIRVKCADYVKNSVKYRFSLGIQLRFRGINSRLAFKYHEKI